MDLIINDPKSCECTNCGAKLLQNNPRISIKENILFRLVALIFLILQIYFLFVIGNTKLSMATASCMLFVFAIFKWVNEKSAYRWKVVKNDL